MKKTRKPQDVLTKEEIVVRKAVKQYTSSLWSRDIIRLLVPMRQAIRAQYAKNLVKTLQHDFSPPFLPPDFVKVGLEELDDLLGGIWLKIGPRDVSIGPDGKSWGSGTSLLGEWSIKDNSKKAKENLTKRLEKGREKK